MPHDPVSSMSADLTWWLFCSLDSAASAPVRDVGLNSPAMVLPSPPCSIPGSDPAVITRTDGKYREERTQMVTGQLLIQTTSGRLSQHVVPCLQIFLILVPMHGPLPFLFFLYIPCCPGFALLLCQHSVLEWGISAFR